MPANALVQTGIDPAVKERAAAVLGELGITVSEAVRTLLTGTANEGALPFALSNNAAGHDAWFRAKVQEALDNPRPGVPHKKIEAHFARRRAAALPQGAIVHAAEWSLFAQTDRDAIFDPNQFPFSLTTPYALTRTL
jgi:DNA-damage-inducible protein J